MIDPQVSDMGIEHEGDAQEFLLFCVAVAGKESRRTHRALDRFLAYLLPHKSFWFTLRNAWRHFRGKPFLPLDLIASVNDEVLERALRNARIGQYTRMKKAYRTLADRFAGRDPFSITVEELEEVPGIGPKTARYYVQYTQGRTDLAAIDTHLLKFLRDQGYDGIPKTTPTAGPLYRRCEQLFLDEAAKRNVNPVEFDFYVWSVYRDRGKIIGFRTLSAEELDYAFAAEAELAHEREEK